MKKTLALTAATAILAGISSGASAHKVVVPKDKEQCYGVAKKAKNDCTWAGGACAGSQTKDADKQAWLFVPKGLCERLIGGSLKPAEPEKKS